MHDVNTLVALIEALILWGVTIIVINIIIIRIMIIIIILSYRLSGVVVKDSLQHSKVMGSTLCCNMLCYK